MLHINNGYGTTYYFEEVQEIPENFIIWNIGRENFPFKKYIPLCETDGQCNINRETLKAYKCEDEAKALKIIEEAHGKPVDKKRILEILEN